MTEVRSKALEKKWRCTNVVMNASNDPSPICERMASSVCLSAGAPNVAARPSLACLTASATSSAGAVTVKCAMPVASVVTSTPTLPGLGS